MKHDTNTRTNLTLTLAEAAYIAGLWEGEGWVGTQNKGRSAILSVKMTDREPLTHLHRLLGGRLRGPYDRGTNKPIYEYRVCGWTTIKNLYPHIESWLSKRRKNQYRAVLAAEPPIEGQGRGSHNRRKTHCPHGHSLSDAYIYERGRQCRTCSLERAARNRTKK